MLTDPIADLFTRIRNAQRAKHTSVVVSKSQMAKNLLDVLKREGFIESYAEHFEGEKAAKFGAYNVELKYFENGDPVIGTIERVSTPGQRVYSPVEKLTKIFSGLGVSILTTSEGVISDREAKKKGIGGEVIARVG
jgi:small subunit ribosomal protein S8